VTRVVIIGGGPGGYEAALVGAQLGADVTIVDRDGIGGSAVLTDCVPSKTLVATAELMSSVQESGELGLRFGADATDESPATGSGSQSVAVDLAVVNQRVRKLAEQQSADIAQRLDKEGVRIVHGTGRLDGPETVVATTECCRTQHPTVN
jgi:NAD(P)H dehydrogenase (quinone)